MIYHGHRGTRIRAIAWALDCSRIASTARREELYQFGGFVDGEVAEMQEFQRSLAQGILEDLDTHTLADAQVWDATSGMMSIRYGGHPKGANDIRWTPTGDRLLTAGASDGTAQVWSAMSGRQVARYADESLSQQSMIMLARAVEESSAAKRSMLQKGAGDVQWVQAALWSSDGQRILATYANEVYVWAADSGQRLLTYGAHRGRVQALTVAPDGRQAASANGWLVHIWDALSRGSTKLIYRGHAHAQRSVFALAWSPDGTRIASSAGGETHVWDASSGATLTTYRGHTRYGMWNALAWSPDSRRLATGGREGEVHIWDAQTGERHDIYREHQTLITAVAWSPDGKRIASGDRDGDIHIWPIG